MKFSSVFPGISSLHMPKAVDHLLPLFHGGLHSLAFAINLATWPFFPVEIYVYDEIFHNLPFFSSFKNLLNRDFPGGAVVKNPPANAGDTGRALVREDPTCRGATKPVRHNYWACALEPVSHNYWARKPQLLKPVRLEPMLRNKRSQRNEKPVHRNKE